MFVDASAIVAILTREPEAEALIDSMERAEAPITSPIAIFEAALGLRRKRRASVTTCEADIMAFLHAARIRVVPVTLAEARTALDAFARYGKGQRHPAQLNLGDCFAYAAARNRKIPLLFKGNDFARTDIQTASAGSS